MTGQPSVAELVKQWLLKARSDLRTAEHTLGLTEDCPYDTVCFHAHQCVEKSLKAVLVASQIPFRKTHDLEELFLLLPPAVPVPVSLGELTRLSPHATDTRYPGAWAWPEKREGEWAVEVARRVLGFVESWNSARSAP